MYSTTQIYNQTTQTTETRKSIWIQIADILWGLGQIFVAIGRALVRIGEFIYEIFFR